MTEQQSRIRFADFTRDISELISKKDIAGLENAVKTFDNDDDNPKAYKLLARAMLLFMQQKFAESITLFSQTKELLAKDEYPAPNSIYTGGFISGQLVLPRRQRPATAMAYRFYKKNLAALQQADPQLAQEIQSADWPEEYTIIELWGGLHLYSAETKQCVILSSEIAQKLEKWLGGIDPITIAGLGTGQELRHCLDRQVDLLHGMTRAHYFFEEDTQKIRVLLNLFDMSEQIHTQETIIFGGSQQEDQIQRIFGTHRYRVPLFGIGNFEIIEKNNKIIVDIYEANPAEEVRRYYQSDEFASRQKQIADGKILPRILAETGRWTTFLKYCAADFEKAFDKIGCQTQFLIEENDVQAITKALHWDTINEFKPDAIFMVSHARPTVEYIPKQLAVIGFIQDKCGPLAEASELTGQIESNDLFVCMMGEHMRWLANKNVPDEQMFVMPTPADETMFYPLAKDNQTAERFAADISFVKHGHGDSNAVLEEFLEARKIEAIDPTIGQTAHTIFRNLHEKLCQSPNLSYSQENINEFVELHLTDAASQTLRNWLRAVASDFYNMVYSAIWRCSFLEAIDEAGLALALYGNGWDKHSKLGHLGKGGVSRDSQLNYVYNFSKINLSITHSGTMHQRLAECGLAGGFMIVADIPTEQDWEPAKKYFEPDKEVIYCDSSNEMVEKCKYYLTHESERQEIAENMHHRALRERTCTAGAKTILDQWRKLLKENDVILDR